MTYSPGVIRSRRQRRRALRRPGPPCHLTASGRRGYLLDTSTVIQSGLRVGAEKGTGAISVVTLCEMRAGVQLALGPVAATRQARLYAVRATFVPLPVDEAVAEHYGDTRAVARTSARIIKATDLLIIATAAATVRVHPIGGVGVAANLEILRQVGAPARLALVQKQPHLGRCKRVALDRGRVMHVVAPDVAARDSRSGPAPEGHRARRARLASRPPARGHGDSVARVHDRRPP